MDRQPAHIINISGEFSPFALLKISQIFREMSPGDIMEIRQCDPETRSDLTRIFPPDACRLSIDDNSPDEEDSVRISGGDARALCRIRLLKTAIIP